MIETNEIEIKQPTSFSREENDTYRWQERLTSGNSAEFNQKSQSECYNPDCNNSELEYYYERDELTCPVCGYVQRQGYKDYTDNTGKYQMTSQEHKVRTKLEEIKNHNNGVGAKP